MNGHGSQSVPPLPPLPRAPGSGPGASSANIAALHAKYSEIRRLRLATETAAAARPALARLARRFPGALRELDSLPMTAIEARLSALEHAGVDPTQRVPWMQAQAEYHSLVRGALAAKRWLGRERTVDGATIQRFATHAQAHARRGNEDLLAWTGDLASVARPPEGKLTKVVFAKVAERLGVATSVARELVVPARPRSHG